MRRQLTTAAITMLVLSCSVGCATDDLARRAISPGYSPGKTDLLWYPSGADMVKSGRLSLAEVIPAPDKTPLDVWVIKARDARNQPAPSTGTVVILHELGSGKGSFPYIGVGERLAKKGYDVVLMDLRAHGRSGGQFITYGGKEKPDVKAVLDKLIAQKAVSDKVYAFGGNLGASVAIQYAAIDPRCQGVVAIAPYKDFRSMARLGMPLVSEAEFKRVMEAAGKMGEFTPEEASAVEAAKKLACPLLVIQGLLDVSVPLDHGKAIYDAAGGPKKLTIVGIEQPILPAFYEDWIADQVDSLAKKGLPAVATSKPAGN